MGDLYIRSLRKFSSIIFRKDNYRNYTLNNSRPYEKLSKSFFYICNIYIILYLYLPLTIIFSTYVNY